MANTKENVVRPTKLAELRGKQPGELELVLPHEALELVEERELKGGRWSGTFWFYGNPEQGGHAFSLKEVPRGTIRCDYQKYNATTGHFEDEWTRVRTGEHELPRALEVALEALINPEWQKRIKNRSIERSATKGKILAHEGLTPVDLAMILRTTGRLVDPEKAESQAEKKKMEKARRHQELVLDLFADFFPDKPIYSFSNADVRDFNERTEDGWVWSARYEGRRNLGKRKDTTIRSNWRDFFTLVGYLVGEVDEQGNKWFQGTSNEDESARQAGNPLNGLDFDPRNAKKEQRPSAHKDRYRYVRPYTRAAEAKAKQDGLPYTNKKYRMVNGVFTEDAYEYQGLLDMKYLIPGILGLMLDHQWVLGWRPDTWSHIQVERDMAFCEEGVVDLLDSITNGDEEVELWHAEHCPHGAVVGRWIKIGGQRYAPYPKALSQRVQRYLQVRERLLEEWGYGESPWLFPDPRDPRRPFDEDRSRTLLYMAEEIAREEEKKRGELSAARVKVVLKDLEDTAWYGYRRTWKTTRNAVGWEGNKTAAYVGHWTTNVGNTADAVYGRLNPHLMLACVEGMTLAEAIATMPETEDFKESMRLASLEEDEFELWGVREEQDHPS